MRVAILVVSLAASALTLEAQSPSPRAVQLVISGGVAVPTGGFSDYHELGTHADVSLLLNLFGQSLRLRPELSYTRFNVKNVGGYGFVATSAAAARTVETDLASSMLGGFANLEIPLGPPGFQPFLMAGVGAVKLKSDATSEGIELDKTKSSFNVGAGLRFRLGRIGGLLEARVNNVPAGDSRAFFKDMRTVPVSFGLIF